MAKDKGKKSWFAKHKILTVILALVGFGIISGAAGGNKTGTTASNTTASTSSTAQPAAAQPTQPAVPAEYKSALAQAGGYANGQHMSKQGVYDQLTSQYGGKFTAPAAEYAIDNVKADWNANALATAKSYQDSQHMSPADIHDQLTSDNGEKFTQAEADYAIAHLND